MQGAAYQKALVALLDTGSRFTYISPHCIPNDIVPTQVEGHHVRTISTQRSTTIDQQVVLQQTRIREIGSTITIDTDIQCYLSPQNTIYDVIIGRDILERLKINIDCGKQTFEIFQITHPFQSEVHLRTQQYNYDPIESAFMIDIKAASYERQDIDDLIAKQKHLNDEQCKLLYDILSTFQTLFNNELKEFKGPRMDIELKPDVQPSFQKAYPVPNAHMQTFQTELNRLCQVRVLEKTRPTGWAAPTFIIPKKNNQIRWVSDFRRLNRYIRRRPYQLPIIHDVLRRRFGYKYFTKIDISMQYYTFGLTDRAQSYCVIATPFGYYKYLRVPMGVLSSPDFAQEQMENILGHLADVEIYLDDIGIFSSSWDDHMTTIHRVLTILQKHNFSVNPTKCEWAVQQTDWLGYWLTPTGLRPWKRKIQAILDIAKPKTITELRSFIGAVTFYRDMFPRRSHILAPLTAIIGANKKKSTPIAWTEEMNLAFQRTKAMLVKSTLLRYPNHNKPFAIYTDASDYQLGAAIFQDGHPVAFYSRKLNSAQRNYTTIEKELLSIVETLKEYRTMIYGSKELNIYTDHSNLTGASFSTQRVLRWRLFLEEYGPTFHYIKGEENTLADALSRLPLEERQDPVTSSDKNPYAQFLLSIDRMKTQGDVQDEFDSGHCYSIISDDEELQQCFMALPEITHNNPYPLRYDVLRDKQALDAKLQQQLILQPDNYKRTLVAPHLQLITYQGNDQDPWKICLPELHVEPAARWYHVVLNHPGAVRLRKTMELVFHSKKLRAACDAIATRCDICQKEKSSGRGHGHLAPRAALRTPWQEIAVDLIGPWSYTWQQYTVQFRALTVIDTCTNLVEIQRVDNKTSAHIAIQFQNCWLTRYPRPIRIIYDRGTEFTGYSFQRLLRNMHINGVPITSKNPQGNSIVERLHQTIGNALRAFRHTELPEGMTNIQQVIDTALQAVAYSARTAIHNTMEISPGALTYHRDMLLDIPIIADLQILQQKRQSIIDANLLAANTKRLSYDYAVADRVLVKQYNPSKLEQKYIGPYPITTIHTNGTVTIRRSPHVLERMNIRRLRPYRE